jgi:hypothetical protein
VLSAIFFIVILDIISSALYTFSGTSGMAQLWPWLSWFAL